MEFLLVLAFVVVASSDFYAFLGLLTTIVAGLCYILVRDRGWACFKKLIGADL